jgi:hypothetical protein
VTLFYISIFFIDNLWFEIGLFFLSINIWYLYLFFYIFCSSLIVWLFVWWCLNVTFNNILVILWQSVLLVEETGENHWPVASQGQTLLHNVLSNTPLHEQGSNSQLQWWSALIAQGVVNPTTTRSQPWWPLFIIEGLFLTQMKNINISSFSFKTTSVG